MARPNDILEQEEFIESYMENNLGKTAMDYYNDSSLDENVLTDELDTQLRRNERKLKHEHIKEIAVRLLFNATVVIIVILLVLWFSNKS